MIYLGNIKFEQVEEKLGYRLSDTDKEIWNQFHSDNADLQEKPSCFHVFDVPRCIQFRGDDARAAILTMFTPDKITNPVGTFQVIEV